jgi:hypothetical protein
MVAVAVTREDNVTLGVESAPELPFLPGAASHGEQRSASIVYRDGR